MSWHKVGTKLGPGCVGVESAMRDVSILLFVTSVTVVKACPTMYVLCALQDIAKCASSRDRQDLFAGYTHYVLFEVFVYRSSILSYCDNIMTIL